MSLHQSGYPLTFLEMAGLPGNKKIKWKKPRLGYVRLISKMPIYAEKVIPAVVSADERKIIFPIMEVHLYNYISCQLLINTLEINPNLSMIRALKFSSDKTEFFKMLFKPWSVITKSGDSLLVFEGKGCKWEWLCIVLHIPRMALRSLCHWGI